MHTHANEMEQFLTRIGIQTGKIKPVNAPVEMESARQDWKQLTPDLSCHTLTPIHIGEKTYRKGLGAHSKGLAVFKLNASFTHFIAYVGIDNNADTAGNRGSVEFIVKVDGREVAHTPICRGGEKARKLDVKIPDAKRLELIVTDAGDGYSYDQADWADARLIDAKGKITYLSDILRKKRSSPFLTQSKLPASFVYGGEVSDKLLAQWPREDKPVLQDDGQTICETVWREPGDHLVATWRVQLFNDTSAMEFRWSFKNGGSTPTKPLTRVLALDLQAALPEGGAQLIHSSGGLTGNMMDTDLGFEVKNTKLENTTLSGAGGRSSNRDLPFFQIHESDAEGGMYVCVGWSGQWRADIGYPVSKETLHVTAEMDGMNLALPPGETLLTPSILLGTYHGNAQAGSNALRRLLYDRYVPLLSGAKPLPPVSWNSWFVLENRITESLLKREADIASDAGIEYFCIDAGWFNGDFPDGVGNWTVNTTKFPIGLKPIGDYVRGKGMKLGLWFEPERVGAGTRLLKEHPAWVHNDLLDFGNADAREWIFQMMKQYIDEGGVRWIRFDFNTDPLGTWNAMDTTETRGLAQARHIAGFYELLDRLMKTYPDLLIEGCASGGRRIDLETIKRSHTFWKSDDTAHLTVMRFHQTGGNLFLPGVLLNTNLLPIETEYDVYSLFGGPLGFGADWTKLSSDKRKMVRRLVAQYKELRPYLNKDYYPLFPQSRDEFGWIGWQFVDPTKGEGFAVVLRPESSSYSAAQIKLQGLSPETEYTLKPAIGKLTKATGQVLMDGLSVSIDKPGSAVIIQYRRAKR